MARSERVLHVLTHASFIRFSRLKFYSVRVSNARNTFIKFILKINIKIHLVLVFIIFKICISCIFNKYWNTL